MDLKKLRHRVQVNISDGDMKREKVVAKSQLRLPRRILKLIFGEMSDILVITTGKTVDSIEIRETGGDGDE